MQSNENKNTKILIIDDDSQMREFLTRILDHKGFFVRSAESGKSGLNAIENWNPNLILLDLHLQDLSGFEVLNRIRDQSDMLTTLIVSGISQKEIIVEALLKGANDYLVKPFDSEELLARIHVQLRQKEQREKLQDQNEKLKELVNVDDLTGLYNMRSLYDKLEIELSRAKRTNRSVSAIMMDMDYFKSVNDSHDHLFGSYVLSEVGRIIRYNIRTSDFGARYGGDEFLMVLTDTTMEGSLLFCERLRKRIADCEFKNEGFSMRLTASLGLAVVEPQNFYLDGRTLVRQADRALYQAKRMGRDQVCFYDYNNPERGFQNEIPLKRLP